MDGFDLDDLLSEISPESPSGEDLEYDPAFVQMEQAAQGKPEQEIGQTVVEAVGGDWAEVKKQALDVLSRSRDLRASVYLTRAAVHTDGIAGLRESLAVVEGYVDRFWESVHPQLDPDDDNDPTMRVNALSTLCDRSAFLTPVRETPLVNSRILGRFSYRDVQVAEGELPPPEGEEPPQISAILGAFQDCEVDEIRATSEAVGAAADSVAAIEATVTRQVGAAQAVALSDLSKLLQRMQRFVTDQLTERTEVGESDASDAVGPGPATATDSVSGSAAPAVSHNGAIQNGAIQNGAIQNREDVVRAINRICHYYEQHEPGSPIPLLLNRAKRLVRKNFLEILEDLTPEGLSDFHQKWVGADNGQDAEERAVNDAPTESGPSESNESSGW